MNTKCSLTQYWTYVAGGKVVEETLSSGVKTIVFEGSTESTHGCAKWGPSYAFSVLVERAEYVRCWERIQSKAWQSIHLLGSKGIGKSVFLYWLIYKLVNEAKAKNSPCLPSFLLISASCENSQVYKLLSHVDGSPSVRRVAPGTYADYVLSDAEHDAAAVPGHWTLSVVGLHTAREQDLLTRNVENAERVSCLIMFCTYFPA
jgi:hypothetical protein